MVYNLCESIQKNTAVGETAELANRSKLEVLANISHKIWQVLREKWIGWCIDTQ